MNTFELTEELVKRPQEEVQYALLQMLINRKLDFETLNRTYVRYLEAKKEDLNNRLMEAETCVAESFHDRKTKDKSKHRGIDYCHTQRCLYLLNQSKRFQMQTLNEKYEYDEEFGKIMSAYERNKESKNKL